MSGWMTVVDLMGVRVSQAVVVMNYTSPCYF